MSLKKTIGRSASYSPFKGDKYKTINVTTKMDIALPRKNPISEYEEKAYYVLNYMHIRSIYDALQHSIYTDSLGVRGDFMDWIDKELEIIDMDKVDKYERELTESNIE